MPDFNETDEPVAFDDATGLPHSKTTRADEEPLGSLFDDAYALYEDGRTYPTPNTPLTIAREIPTIPLRAPKNSPGAPQALLEK